MFMWTFIHETWGQGSDSVNIPSPVNFSNTSEDATVYSGVKFDDDGDVYRRQAGGGWSRVGTWLQNGTNSDFYISRTTSDTLDTDAGAGPLQMNSDRIYDVQRSGVGTDTAEVIFEISNDAGGTPVVAGPTTYTFYAEKETSN